MKHYTITISFNGAELRLLLLGIHYIRTTFSTPTQTRDYPTIIELEKKLAGKKQLLDEVERKGVIL